MPQSNSIRFIAISVLALCLGACRDESPSSPAVHETVADYLTSASVDSTPGIIQDTRIPRPGSEGPAISVDGHLTIVNGGTATLHVTSPTPFATVYVSASAPISDLFARASGRFEIPMPAPATSADLFLVFPQELPATEFDLYFAAADSAGHIGNLAARTTNAIIVGTGDIQVTAQWDSDADVDVHVVDPSGEEVYWDNRQSVSGGQLDLDSNAACVSDDVRNENITWAEGTAPQGTYMVRLDYWSSCDVVQTNYTVLINNGGDISIVHGTFTGSGDAGGYGSGIDIGTFTRTTGPLPAPRQAQPATQQRGGVRKAVARS